MTPPTQILDQDATAARLAALEAQLGMTASAQAQRRIAELEAALAERAPEQQRLYAVAQSWRQVHDDLRAEAAAVQKRQIDAKRGAARDLGVLAAYRDETRRLNEELAALQAQVSGHTVRMAAPVVRSLAHAPRP